jgi:hypothetical protein
MLRLRQRMSTDNVGVGRCVSEGRGLLSKHLDCTQLTATGLRNFLLIIGASCHYRPITAILYTSSTGMVASVIQADSA